jgi:hypothetical protein
MNLQIGAGGYSIQVLLKPHNVSSDVYYQAELYEGNLLVGAQDVMWSGDDIAAQRDAVVIFPLRELAPQVKESTAKLTSTYHVTITPTTTPTTTPTSMPTLIYQGEMALDIDLHDIQTAVGTYAIQSGKWPTANSSLPPTGQYALIDFNASFDNGGKIMSFYPHFISSLPRHFDEGVWRIDSAALVSIDMAPDKY